MQSSHILSSLGDAYKIHNLEFILTKTNSCATGFMVAIAATIPKNIIYHAGQGHILKILVPSIVEGLLLIGYLMAAGYHTVSMDQALTLDWPSDGIFLHSLSASPMLIQLTFHQTPAVIAADNLKVPVAAGAAAEAADMVSRRITWLTKPEASLTEDDHDLIQKYREDAGFVIFIQEPKQLSSQRERPSLASPARSESTGSNLRVKPRLALNALSPHAGMPEEVASAFSSIITAGASGLPLPQLNSRRQKAAPNTSDDTASRGRGRTRTDSELSDFNDCAEPPTLPASIPRIYFGAGIGTASYDLDDE
jgi:hypothetical protein